MPPPPHKTILLLSIFYNKELSEYKWKIKFQFMSKKHFWLWPLTKHTGISGIRIPPEFWWNSKFWFLFWFLATRTKNQKVQLNHQLSIHFCLQGSPSTDNYVCQKYCLVLNSNRGANSNMDYGPQLRVPFGIVPCNKVGRVGWEFFYQILDATARS